MRRAPIVAAVTVAGLAGLAAFRTTPVPVTLSTVPTTSTAGGTASASTTGGATTSSTLGRTSGTTLHHATRAGSRASTTTTTVAATTRTAVGDTVDYDYGTLSVSVTVRGSTIVAVGVASLDDGGNPRSASIDDAAIPVLEAEAKAAQGAGIQSVSGASYTSAGFERSLQSALSKLGV